MNLLSKNLPKRSIWNTLKVAWQEAFPPEVQVSEILNQRRLKFKQQKEIENMEWTDEQLNDFESRIPEWKKGAIIFLRSIDDGTTVKSKRKPVIRNYVRQKYKDNADVQNLLNELEGVKDSVKIFHENVQQKILYSNNLIVNTSVNVIGKVKEKMNSDAIAEMKKRDPEFDFDLFEKEIRFIFEETYHEFLKHNIKQLEKTCTMEALGHFRQLIAEHQAKFAKPKYTDILNVSFPVLETSLLAEDKTPIFGFSINFQMINCLIDPKEPETILDGDETRMIMCDYIMYVMPNPNPNIEEVGHGWIFFKMEQRNKVRQLI